MIKTENIILAYEYEIISWIKENYKELGYEKIIKCDTRGFPDFIMEKDGKEIRVEVEIYSKSFLKHKHDINQVDEILCIVDDAKLLVKTIEIKDLKLWYYLSADERVDLFKELPESLLINHKTGEQVYHFQDDWLNLSKEREQEIRKNLRETETVWRRFRK